MVPPPSGKVGCDLDNFGRLLRGVQPILCGLPRFCEAPWKGEGCADTRGRPDNGAGGNASCIGFAFIAASALRHIQKRLRHGASGSLGSSDSLHIPFSASRFVTSSSSRRTNHGHRCSRQDRLEPGRNSGLSEGIHRNAGRSARPEAFAGNPGLFHGPSILMSACPSRQRAGQPRAMEGSAGSASATRPSEIPSDCRYGAVSADPTGMLIPQFTVRSGMRRGGFLCRLRSFGTAAAVADAIFHATGRRFRSLPITPRSFSH